MKKHLFTGLLLIIGFYSSGQKTEFGLSLQQSVTMVSNKQKLVSDLPSGGAADPIDRYAKGLWYANSFTIDTYWFKKKMIVSAGFNSFRMKYISDSVLPSLSSAPQYGQRTVSRVFIFAKIGLSYRHPIGEHLNLQSSISFGAPQFMSRIKARGVAYSQEGQGSWDNSNRTYSDGVWDIYADKKSFLIEIGQQLVYDINRWSISTGFSYFFFRNWLFQGYHGLHLNAGCSVRFGD